MFKQKGLRRILSMLVAAAMLFTALPAAHAESDGGAVFNLIAAGGNHTVAQKTDGSLWAWGNNLNGQLGNGTTTWSNIPVHITGLTDVKELAGGGHHTVALQNDGTVWAWGSNNNGQLGSGDTTPSDTPVQVNGLEGVKAIAAGQAHTVAINHDDTVLAWGGNLNGQLGDGTTVQRNSPVTVSSLTEVKAITAGDSHTVALKQDGTVWTWGYNFFGQLGNGSQVQKSDTPVQVTGLSEVIAISAAGNFNIALEADGTVWTWGINDFGQLGNGDSTNSNVPVQVKSSDSSNFAHVKLIKAGRYHGLAVKDDDTVWAWGLNNFGQLGDGSLTNRNVPVQVKNSNSSAFTGAIAVSAGDVHTVAIKSNGELVSWGANRDGQLGIGNNTPKNYAEFIPNDRFAGGDGSEADPYQIKTPAQLNEVRNYLDKNFIVMNDIDLNDPLYNEEGLDWAPIGTEDFPFTGKFNGNGNKILGLKIQSDSGYLGLFGHINAATISNVALENVNIIGTNGLYVGALIGYMDGDSIVQNASSSGTVTADDSVGGLIGGVLTGSVISSSSSATVHSESARSGGLIGQASGMSNSSLASIRDSFATGDVIGDPDDASAVGGLIGIAMYTKIERSYSSEGTVSANANVGGFIGSILFSQVSESYSSKELVKGDAAVGGFVGFSLDTTFENTYTRTDVEAGGGGGYAGNIIGNTMISYSYSTGKLSGEGLYGFAYANNSSNFEEVYYDGEKSEATSKDDDIGKKLLTSELKTQNTFDNETNKWNFSSIWMINPRGVINDGYPYLRAIDNQNNPTYTVTYNGNDAADGTVPTDSETYATGATVTVKGNTGDLAKTGFTFAGWNTRADGNGTTYAAGVTFQMESENVMLYAKWTASESETYIVKYNGNGATGGTVPESAEYATGATVTVLPNSGNLTKAGFAFVGWNTRADGRGTDYSAGSTLIVGTSNIMLYAKWNAVAPNPNPSPESSPSPAHTAPASEEIVVDVKAGAGETIAQTKIIRTTEPNGRIKDNVTFTPDRAQQVVNQLKNKEDKTARIVIPDEKDKVSEVDVNVPRNAVNTLANGKANLEIYTDNVRILIPYESFNGFDQDLYFRLVPMKKDEERREVEDRAKQEEQVRKIAKNQGIKILGRPMTIETNMQSHPVTLILPLKDSVPQNEAARQAILDNLVIFIEHSDGTKELVRGELVTYKDGGSGIQFGVTKFSTFTMVYMEGSKEYFAALQQAEAEKNKQSGMHKPYIYGLPDGTFGPEQTVTRSQMAAMLARNLGAEYKGNGISTFTDIDGKYWAFKEIEIINQLGLMIGCSDGRFGAEDGITRAQMAMIIDRWMTQQGKTVPVKTTAMSYTDLPSKHWAYEAIDRVQAYGIMVGYEDQSFRPEQMVTRAEAVKVLNRLFDRGPLYEVDQPSFRDVPISYWAFNEIEEAAQEHHWELDQNGREVIKK